MTALHQPLRLSALSLAMAALLTACGGGDALPPGSATVVPAASGADTVAPVLSISSSAAGGVATGDVTFTFTFNESVGASFTADDIVVTGGTKGTFFLKDTSTATLVVTPAPNATGSIEVSIPALAYKDATGNANTASASATQAYNTKPPVSGATGTCTAAPCVGFEANGMAMVAFGGLAASVVADPGDAGNKVVKLVKAVGNEVWAGATIDPSGTGASTVPAFGFATSKMVTLRMYSPKPGEVIMLKVESAADGAVLMEAQATTTLTGDWETLTFNFAAPTNGSYNAAKTYDRVSVFPHFGTQVTADTTYYVDELKYTAAPAAGGGGAGTGTTLISFDEATAPKLTDFGTNGAGAAIVTDPAGGTNKVLKVFKYANPAPGSEQWAGTTVSTGANDSIAAIPFSATAKTMTVRVYSPAAGVRVRLKVENASNGGITCETDAVTTKSGAWETLTFDFASPAKNPPVTGGPTAALDLAQTYNKVSIFMDFGLGNGGSGPLPADRTYYADDIAFVAGAATGGGSTPAPLIYASDYRSAGAAAVTAEGGDAGNYIDGAATQVYTWGGVASLLDMPAPATPSYYFGWGLKNPTQAGYLGGFVKAPGNGTAAVSSYSNLNLTVWGNDELVNTHPHFTVILKGPAVSGCAAELKGDVAVAAAGVQTYNLPLSGFTLQTACAYASAAAALAGGVNEVHVQVLPPNIQYTTFDSGGAAGATYPNGLNLGPIKFN